MKNLFNILICTIILLACSSKGEFSSGNLTINVQLDSAAHKNIILEKIPSGPKRIQLDTIEALEDGTAQFKLEIPKIGLYCVYVEGGQGEIKFIGEPGTEVNVNGNAKSLYATGKISGTPENNRFDSLTTFIKATKYYTDSLFRVFEKAKAKQLHYALKDEFEILYRNAKIKEENFAKHYIDNNPSQFSNIKAVEVLNAKRHQDYILKVDSALMAEFPDHEDVIRFHEVVEKIFATAQGKPAKDFTLMDINNKQISLSDFKGKYVLLDFWATTCRPCIQEIPNLKKVQQALKNEPFEIVSVCVDRNNPNTLHVWKKIIEKNDANWVQLFDAEGMATVQKYQIKYFPTIFLIGPDGRILDTGNHIRGENTLNVIKSFMKDE